MAKILILINGHLCMAPRPQKEAETLASAGHDVMVRGFWTDTKFAERDRLLLRDKHWQFKPILDCRPERYFNNFKARLRARIALERYRRFQNFSPDMLGYGIKAALEVARKTKADLTIVHSEGGLWIGQQLLKEGFRIGVDFEDWFSKDLLPEARILRPISQIEYLERTLIRKCVYSLTTSQVMSTAMSKSYRSPNPTVVYNSFPFSERATIDNKNKDRKNTSIPSLHWFSQTIGPGRGLEILFKALPLLKKTVEIHLRGNYPDNYRRILEPQIPEGWRNQVFVHSTVSNAELISRVAEHDIGLALESPNVVSRNFTITNKFFQYLQAGIAVIATDTEGQKEVLSQFPSCGQLISTNSPQSLATAINILIENPEKLAAAKQSALFAAREIGWEAQKSSIIETVSRALDIQS